MGGFCATVVTATAFIASYILPWNHREVCHSEYGCFSIEAPFTNSLGYLPKSPEQLNVSLELHTRNGKSFIDLRKKTGNTNVFFSNIKNIKVVIHGFMGSESSQWIVNMADELLKKEDSNVFVVQWEKEGDECNYYQAVADTRLVAAIVSKYLDWILETNSMSPSSVHLIGASLGAHIAGYIGQRINGIGRITGLDPASYAFEDEEEEVHLSPNDAVFVDVIHTDDGYGISSPIGDVDFYVNGGLDQPGCSSFNDYNSCSHSRAFELFVESINSPCFFTSFPCYLDQVSFGSSACTSCGVRGCSNMGFGASKRRPGIYFTNTRGEKPFCISNSVLL